MISLRFGKSLVTVSLLALFVAGCSGDADDALDGDVDDPPASADESADDTAAASQAAALRTHSHCSTEGAGATSTPCTVWTGGYPSGYVWASAGLDQYGIKLQRCSDGGTGYVGRCGPISTVAVAYGHPARTPRVKANSKYGWYRACTKSFSTSRWFCGSGQDWVYLGD